MQKLTILKGTEKQVAWANSIREKYFAKISEYKECCAGLEELWKLAKEAGGGWKYSTPEQKAARNAIQEKMRLHSGAAEYLAILEAKKTNATATHGYFDSVERKFRDENPESLEWDARIFAYTERSRLAEKFLHSVDNSHFFIDLETK